MKRKALIILPIILSIVMLGGCGLKDKIKDGLSTKNVGMNETVYVIDTSSLGGENISIELPEGFTTIGDTDTTMNSYVSLYHTKTTASEDDYVITYTIAKDIYADREETLHTYKNMYSSFLASEVKELELSNGIKCNYYTATYILAGETLTDYIAQFDKNSVTILAKLGTTFYPLDVSELEACELLYEYLN